MAVNVKGKRIAAIVLACALLLNNSSFYSFAAEISGEPETGYTSEEMDELEEKEEIEETVPEEEITDDASTGGDEDEDEAGIDNEPDNLLDGSGEANPNNGSVSAREQIYVSGDAAIVSGDVPETMAEGSCGEGLIWTLSKEGLLKIEGTGSMTNYKSGTAPWFNYKESVSNLQIGDGIETIGSYAFYSCDHLSGNLILPKSLQTIGKYAFYNCQRLEGDLNIPDSVVSVGSCAFYGCSGFKGTLKLSGNLKTINQSTFNSCSGLKGTLRIPDSVKSIHYYAFDSCNGFTSVVFGQGIENLYGDASTGACSFYRCYGIGTVTFLGENVPVINSSLSATSSNGDHIKFFFGCNCFARLKTIRVPKGCYRQYASEYGSHLQEQTRIVEEGAKGFIIENGVLTAYTGSEKSVKVPVEVTEIGDGAFLNNTFLTEIVFPEGLEVIGNVAFKGCSALTEIQIPEGVRRIGSQAFYNCAALSGTLELPKNLTEIGEYAFYECQKLTGGLLIPSGVTELKPYVFYGCVGLDGNISLPEGLESVGAGAFYECQKLTGGLELPEGLQTIEEYAFSGCQRLEGDLNIPDSVASVGAGAFSRCSGLSGSLRIPDNVKSIDYYTFKACSSFTDVVFGQGIENLYGSSYSAGYPFYNCSGVETVTFLGEKVPVINSSLSATSSNGDYIRSFFAKDCFAKLKTIYVPASSLNAYKTAWENYVPAGVTFSANITILPSVANLKADYVNSHSLCLTWNPSTSKAVIGYNIYRDDVKVADVTEEKFLDIDLESNQTYKYKVTGYTENGEETLDALLDITTSTPKVNKIYTDNKLNKIGLTNGWLYASVDDTGNLKSAKGRFYYLDANEQKNWISDELTDIFSRSSNSAVYRTKWDISEIEPGSYTVGFELLDGDGEKGELSQVISVDDSRPEAVSNVVAVGGINQIILSWSMAHEIDTEKYYIFRRAESEDEYTLIKRIYDRNTLTYTDTKATINQKYYYYITGVNSFGQEGERSKIAIAMPQTDTELPRVVQLTPVNGSFIGGNAKLYLNAEDNVSVTRTELYLSLDNGSAWTLLTTAKESHCSFSLPTGVYSDQFILVKGLAYDAAGNISTPLIYSYKIDNTGPEQVTGLSYESTATTITLHWKDVADNDFSFFRVEQKMEDGSFRNIQDVSTTLGANIYNLESDTEYIYRVAAYDRLGNRGQASEEIVARTQVDESVPVITAMKPNAGYHNKEIPVRITATDNTGIASILIQTSDNAIIWNDYKTVAFSGSNKAETVAENISLEQYAEGNLYIRGIAKDKNGNSSDSSDKAPYVQYIVDRTAPKAPKNFKSNAVTGAIELKWDMGEETDLDGYTLYRSLDGEKYSVLAKGLHSVNYWDRSVQKDTCYWYKAAVCDLAGNISEETEAVSASLPNDTEKPKIENFSPDSGSIVGISNQQFSVMASDNWKLDKVKVTYTINDNEDVNTLINQSGIDNYYKVLNADLPITSLKSGDILHLNISVTDMQGLSTVKENIIYTVDKTAPRVEKLSAEADKEKITVLWKGNAEPDLAGYRIYRKKASGSYELIGQRSAAAGQEYQYEDYNALSKETYHYKVEAVDKCGNTHAKESEAVWLVVEPAVTAEMVCDKMLEVNVEYYFDAASSFADLGISSYRFEFGDGIIREGESAKIIHRYAETGDYTVKMTVTDKEGHQASVTREVTVQESRLVGTAKIKVVDAAGGKIIGLPVYFDMDHTSDNVKYTDSNGYVTFNASAGAYAVGSYADGYLPVKKSIIVRAGTESQLEITLVKEAIVTGEFEIDRMTLDEIKAAGIDVSNPANQQVVQVTVHLTYGSTPITMNVVTNGKKIYSGGTVIADTSEGRRKLTVAVIDTGDAGNKGSGAGGTGTAKDENIILAILDAPVEASFLKEFFDVKLHIINHADSQFELTNNIVHLHVPEGMTMMDSTYTIANDTIFFDSLKGQSETTLHWILRGDKAGEYDLEADYTGVLNQFNVPVSAKFKTETPITVYGLDAVKIIADINSSIFYGGMYFDLSLQNKGGAEMYLPNIDVDGQILNLYEHIAAEDEETSALSAEDELSGGGEFSGGGGAGGGGGAISDKPSYKDVKLLDVILKNKKAYTQYLGKNAVVEKLSAGETLTKKYVSYNAITENDVAYLQKAVVKAAEDLGIEVEVNIVNMDLFGIEDADDKAHSFFTDQEKRDLYDFFINNQNFKYYIDAEKDDEDFGKKLGEAFKRSADAVLNFDFDIFTNDDMKHITRQYIYDMLMDESFQRSTYDRIDDTYLKVTKSTLSVIKGWLPQDKGDILMEDAAVKNFVDGISDAENIRKLAGELKINGSEAFYERLCNMALAGGASVIPEVLKHCLEKNKIIGCVGNEISKTLKEVTTVLGVISDATDAWNTSVELTNQLIAINAAQEEARTLLSFIIKHEEINEIVRKEAQEILNGMNEGIKKQSDTFTEEFAKNLLETGVGAGTGWVLGLLDKIYYPNATFGVNTAVTAIRLVYNSFDYAFDWEDSVNSLQRLRIAGALTLVLRRETISYKVSGDNETFLMALKYLIKMRLVGEKAWVDIYRDNGIKTIESDFAGGGKQDIDEYYKDYKEMILSYRDILFGQVPELQNVPKAPEVEIDYVQETTKQKYDLDYEYSFNGTKWIDCDGGSIALKPGTAGKHLWVRKKESSSNMAGNITKRYIPARALISDDISVKYKGGNYYIEGLPSTACYQLSDKKLEEISATSAVEPKEQTTVIKDIGKYYPYMAISLAATNYGFSTRVSNYEVEKARTLSISNDTSCGSVTGAGEYFAGESVTMKAQTKAGYTFAGWYQNGKLLSASPEYVFTIYENCRIEARFEKQNVPKAPEVEIDYVQETTKQKYDSDYEYSFNGTEWVDCDGGTIALKPGTTGKHLWVRKKASASNMAGDITKRYIPARDLISDDISVKYKGGNYYIEGLPSAARYQLSDKKLEGISAASVVEPREQTTVIKDIGKYYPYMAISLAATNYGFSSRVSNYEVERARTLSISNDTFCGNVTGAGEYFAGESVTVKAQTKAGYTFAGWYQNGKLLSASPEYVFTIYEDCRLEARFENILLSAVQEAKKDEVVKAGLPPDSIVPKEVLAAAAERNVSLELSAGEGTYWEIDGKKIAEGAVKDLDLSIIRTGRENGAIPKEFIDDFAGTYGAEQLNLSEGLGAMPAVALKLEMDINRKGWKCVTFLCDKNREMSVVKNCILSENTMVIDVSKGDNYLLVYGKNGDVTKDDQVTMKDLMKILHHVSGRNSLTLLEESFANVDLQNGVKMSDLMKVLHFVSGRSKEL